MLASSTTPYHHSSITKRAGPCGALVNNNPSASSPRGSLTSGLIAAGCDDRLSTVRSSNSCQAHIQCQSNEHIARYPLVACELTSPASCWQREAASYTSILVVSRSPASRLLLAAIPIPSAPRLPLSSVELDACIAGRRRAGVLGDVTHWLPVDLVFVEFRLHRGPCVLALSDATCWLWLFSTELVATSSPQRRARAVGLVSSPLPRGHEPPAVACRLTSGLECLHSATSGSLPSCHRFLANWFWVPRVWVQPPAVCRVADSTCALVWFRCR